MQELGSDDNLLNLFASNDEKMMKMALYVAYNRLNEKLKSRSSTAFNKTEEAKGKVQRIKMRRKSDGKEAWVDSEGNFLEWVK